MTTSFERFQERNKKRAQSTRRNNASFLIKGYNSTIITRDGVEVAAAVVNEQEKGVGYIYTALDKSLSIGDVWTAKDRLHFLIVEEIIVIKDVDWHKYKAVLCNIQINNEWGRFIGSEESYVSVELKQDISIHSKQKPLLILPTGSLQIQDKVIIQGRAWLVQEQDFITTPGISYYSLTSTTASKTTEEQDSYIESYSEDYSIDQNTFTPNTNITVPTESGYFRSDIAQIKIVSRNSSQVVFQIPFGVDQVTISTKKEGVVVQTTYRVQ